MPTGIRNAAGASVSLSDRLVRFTGASAARCGALERVSLQQDVCIRGVSVQRRLSNTVQCPIRKGQGVCSNYGHSAQWVPSRSSDDRQIRETTMMKSSRTYRDLDASAPHGFEQSDSRIPLSCLLF